MFRSRLFASTAPILGTAATLMALAAPGHAAAATVSFRPVSVGNHTLTYRVSRLRPGRVRSAQLVWGGHHRRISRARVISALRHHQALRLRRPHTRPGTVAPSSTQTPSAPPAPAQPAPLPAAAPLPVPTLVIATATPASTQPAVAPAPDPPAVPARDSATVDSAAIASGTVQNPACLPGFGAFAAGIRPPGCWRPYGENSPFNRQIPDRPPLVSNSSAIVSRLLGFGSLQNLNEGQAGTPNDYARPVYYSTPADPIFTIHCTKPWGTCAVEGQQIHIPDAARAAGADDGHLTVIDQLSGTEYDFWQVIAKPAGGGVLQVSWGGSTSINGDGLGSDATAARFGTAGGLLREEELAAGHINHALFIAVNCDSGSWVYPATKGGSPCSDPTNAPPEGTRFQLAMSDAQIDALNVPAWKKTILTAMAHYGLIVGDTGGSWQIQSESGVQYTSMAQPDKWVGFAKKVGAPYYSPDNDYVLNLASGVDWAKYLRVVDPCVSRGTC